VDHNKTLHDPHDANAYIRSRRTVAKLLGSQPIALFDIHRNSAPVAQYKLTSGGEQVAKVVIVVGRANPYLPTTTEYAKQLKAAADAKHPQLVRGIFFANGSYNQDVHPRAVLIEIGTEGSTLAEAQKGATRFADAIPAVLGVSQEPPPGSGPTTPKSGEGAPKGGEGAPKSGEGALTFGSGTLRNILWLVGVTMAGGITYLYISAGSWSAARQKLAQFRNLEFANLLGIRSKKKK
jgi:stage II sporulation protein P